MQDAVAFGVISKLVIIWITVELKKKNLFSKFKDNLLIKQTFFVMVIQFFLQKVKNVITITLV